MIEKLITSIITDLGPTGLLVIGLYFSISIPLLRIVKAVEGLKVDTIASKECVIECTRIIVECLNGKD